ncbi:MAG TPA: rhamnulokinase [Anaerolineae bacterium]|nr:rhamnulokinase [Anaerolineae bacterium]HQH39265.1 rhamnulokinase [Anaerolineae bacterium]
MANGENSVFLAVDLGAESGRVVAGMFDGERIALEEVHRFSNGPVNVRGHLHWDVLRLWSDIKIGLAQAAHLYGNRVAGVGLDTWGVDFALLDANDELLGNPYHYRDARTEGMMERAFEKVTREAIFAATGIQFMPLNTLIQLVAMVEARSPALDVAQTLLMMPDLLNFWLTGVKTNEFSDATTSQCYNPRAGTWAYELLEQLDIPTRIFRSGIEDRIVPPGTVLGPLLPSVSEETGLDAVPVIAPATHDTGSAVAAVPMDPDNALYLSSGTWSLMGVESTAPIINADMLTYNLTNEGGVNGTFRLLKNIMGLWLVQECRREWQRAGEDYDYDEMVKMAAAAPAFGPLIYPGADRFLAPGDMTPRIQAFCRETGQAVPQTHGAVLRCVLESLALEYRWVAEKLDALTGKRLGTIHIIGGGSKNELLDQLTADATGRTVVAGPVEATALGNVLVQAVALGHIDSIAQGREVVARSFALKTFMPHDPAAWDEAYRRYLKLRG